MENTGLQIQGEFLLKVLADHGCRVDMKKHRAWFKPDLVERQIAQQRGRYKMVRSSLWYPFCREIPEDDVAWPDEFSVDFGFGTPRIYDYSGGVFRQATKQDQTEMIKLGNALDPVKAVCAPFICSEFETRIETIETSRLLLLNTKKPGWVGVSSGKEVKYLAEFALLAAGHDNKVFRSQPPIFVHTYCTTSPLKIDRRSCEVLEEALKYKFPVNFASMPILGATAPVTPAGSIVVATAEIIGGITASSLIDPDIYYYATSISAEMDMKTTQICYSTPGAILTDGALHQLFRNWYGIVLNVEPAYYEAKGPGIQSSFMRTFRQMCFGCTASFSLPIGLLDNASAFSPTQAMLDLDVSEAMYKFARGIEVNEETMCVGLINELKFCEQGTYLETEHTLTHFREMLWDTKFFDRRCDKGSSYIAGQRDDEILSKADQAWRNLVSSQEPVEVDVKFRAELDRIVEAAKKELLV